MSCGPGKTAMRFDQANPEAVKWAEQEAARLVTDVTTEAREAIRMVVARGIEDGVPPRETAKLIRATVGLTERDASAVMNRQLELMERGVSAEKAAERAETYANTLLRSRAETIARTETMSAANAGQQQLWQQAADQGLIDPDESRKVWIATDDACPRCQELDGQEVGLDSGFGAVGDPPLHPNCRCTIGLVF